MAAGTDETSVPKTCRALASHSRDINSSDGRNSLFVLIHHQRTHAEHLKIIKQKTINRCCSFLFVSDQKEGDEVNIFVWVCIKK